MFKDNVSVVMHCVLNHVTPQGTLYDIVMATRASIQDANSAKKTVSVDSFPTYQGMNFECFDKTRTRKSTNFGPSSMIIHYILPSYFVQMTWFTITKNAGKLNNRPQVPHTDTGNPMNPMNIYNTNNFHMNIF